MQKDQLKCAGVAPAFMSGENGMTAWTSANGLGGGRPIASYGTKVLAVSAQCNAREWISQRAQHVRAHSRGPCLAVAVGCLEMSWIRYGAVVGIVLYILLDDV